MAKKTYVMRDGVLRVLKEGVDLAGYLAKHPGAYKTCCKPSMARLERWSDDGVCPTVTGCCDVEPDGVCGHGKPSWIMALGYM